MKKQIANIITLCNLISGSVGLLLAFKGDFQGALVAMLVAALFDFCDGLVARALHTSSPLGKELDSLSDVVSFGVLPSVMFCLYSGSYLPLLVAAASAYRLAKFNIDERQSYVFRGLATPACGLLLASTVAFACSAPASFVAIALANRYVLILLVVFLAFLLMSEIPMFSMKITKGDEYKTVRFVFFGVSAVAVATALAFHLSWTVLPALVFALYILVNFVSPIIVRK